MLIIALLVGVVGSGPWVWPVDAPHQVLRAFDPPATRYAAGHRGVDLAAPVGSPVRAAGAGRISYAGLLAGRGVVVVVHGELRTTYEPVAAGVRVGAAVTAGQVLGRLTSGGHCGTAACLHWGLRRGEDYLDPLRLVGRGPVRLLPLDQPAAGLPAAGLPASGVAPPAAAPPKPAPSAAAGPLPAPPVDEPAWSLRASETPLGTAALLALVLGIALLVRPRSRPPDPASGGVAAPAAPPAPEPALLLDLDAARVRRKTAS